MLRATQGSSQVRKPSTSHGSGSDRVTSEGLQNLTRRVGVGSGDPTQPDPIRPTGFTQPVNSSVNLVVIDAVVSGTLFPDLS